MKKKSVAMIALFPIMAMGMAFYAWAGVPTEKIKETTDKILSIVTDPSLKDPSKGGEKKALIRKVVDEMCDWEEMARRSLGRHWAQRSDEEKKEFVHLFGQLLERTYSDRVEGYSGEKVNYIGERVDGDYAEVEVKVVTSKNTEIPVVYKLRAKDKNWWVYDIAIEGVSLVHNYRTQFSNIMATSSYQGLVKKLKEKVEEKQEKP